MPVKFTASKNLANVLTLVTTAPVKSFPGVTTFTFNKIAVIKFVTLLIVNVGLGN